MSYSAIRLPEISKDQRESLIAMRNNHIRHGKTIAAYMLYELIVNGHVELADMIGECDGSTQTGLILKTWDELTQLLMRWNSTFQQNMAFA